MIPVPLPRSACGEVVEATERSGWDTRGTTDLVSSDAVDLYRGVESVTSVDLRDRVFRSHGSSVGRSRSSDEYRPTRALTESGDVAERGGQAPVNGPLLDFYCVIAAADLQRAGPVGKGLQLVRPD
jgi:hypothetical protein